MRWKGAYKDPHKEFRKEVHNELYSSLCKTPEEKTWSSGALDPKIAAIIAAIKGPMFKSSILASVSSEAL